MKIKNIYKYIVLEIEYLTILMKEGEKGHTQLVLSDQVVLSPSLVVA